MKPQHVVLIGAARSGTKVLRDALALATGVGKVPYDIGYVWRVGNEAKPDDALTPEVVSERARRFVRGFVDRYAAGMPPAVLEKTVGNTLRVPVVAAVFPDARYVHLVRDGIDVIESTRRQWTAPIDIRYLAGKSKHFPARLVPTYGVRYLRSTVHRRRSVGGRIGSWGPRYRGIDEDLRRCDLLTVCARQWRNSVEQASADLALLSLPVVEVRYEELVQDPESELARIAAFAGLPLTEAKLHTASRGVTPGRHGMGRQALTTLELELLDVEVGGLLAELGYDRPMPVGVEYEDI